MNKRLTRPITVSFPSTIRTIRALLTVGILLTIIASFCTKQCKHLENRGYWSFSGASADFGVPMLNGIQMAVDEINAVGGYSAAS